MEESLRQASLSSLPLDILYIILDILRLSYGPQVTICRVRKSLGGLSRCNKYFRDACFPFLFYACAIRGNWTTAIRGLETLNRDAGLASHIR